MFNPPLTYGQLDAVLRELGFTVVRVKGESRTYCHMPTGAEVALPDRSMRTKVLPHHRALARCVVYYFGLGDLDQYLYEKETNNLAWRAFALGVRAALASHGIEPSNGDITALAAPLNGAVGKAKPGAECVLRFGRTSIRAERELAAKIARGFEESTESRAAEDAQQEVSS